ncbi:4-(cytidine 5'-diphospho)-2-C-methyl-D-erythritol kinase [Desulfovibrio sp. OttesenSCG-928-O18]|nr:4-(cytidine 5'-diphospho)-2-C-methyl-D-erythritol kinase [Desulfovibrio sp. OttesenSCG-928-O18]
MRPNGSGPARLFAGCKINLFLRITGRLANGYHTLESFFLPLEDPVDTITITRKPESGIDFSCTDASLEQADNIMVKAYKAYAAKTGHAPGLHVSLDKRIPYGAGLGGGSSDAAALLAYLNNDALTEGAGGLDEAGLNALAATLGADVPFFLVNRPALVRGIGEIIEPTANPLAGLHLVLVCPKVHVATGPAFAAWDAKNGQKHAADALTNRDWEDTSPLVRGIRVQNDLARIVFEIHPELQKIVASLYKCNAAAASMSGSGSSLFGIFCKKSDAENAERLFLDAGERVFYRSL